MPPSSYVQGHSAASQARHGARNAANTCQYFTNLLKPDMSILDVGCGPGSISSSLAALVLQGSVIGIDSNENTLEIARKQQDLPSNCTFRIGDAHKLEFPDYTFDVVHTSQVLTHIADSIGVLKEFYRVLKPGGFIACREGDTASGGFLFHPVNPGLEHWGYFMLEGMRAKGAHIDAGRRLLGWVVEAGFDIEKCKYIGGCLTQSGKEGSEFGLTMAKQCQEDEVMRSNLIDNNITDEKGLELASEGWAAWAKDPYCVFNMYCGQIVAYK